MGQTFLFLETKSPILWGQIYRAKNVSCTSTMGMWGGGGGRGGAGKGRCTMGRQHPITWGKSPGSRAKKISPVPRGKSVGRELCTVRQNFQHLATKKATGTPLSTVKHSPRST